MSEPQIAAFIEENLQKTTTTKHHESLSIDDPAIVDAEPAKNDDEDSDADDEYNIELVR